jgi:putative ABC transport system substrate-binding protein
LTAFLSRRAFGLIGGAGLIMAISPSIASLTAEAQTAAKTSRIGILGVTPRERVLVLYDAFRQGLSQLGYTEGQQVTFVDQHADGAPSRLPALAAELIRTMPDVIFARGPAAVAAAAQATRTIPIVAVDLESDPIALGYARSLARPGGNVTGVFLDLPELSAKQLQLIQEVIPGLSRLALLGDPTGNAAQFRAAERAAQALGVQTQKVELRSEAELDGGLEAVQRSRAGAVLIFSSPIVFANGARIATRAREARLPTVSLFTEFTELGGLLTYGPSLRDSFRRCGVYVGRILGGAKPAELPIERPEKFELVINVKTATALGLTIPPSLMLRADHIVK